MTLTQNTALLFLTLGLALSACKPDSSGAEKKQAEKLGPKPTLVSIAKAQSQSIEITEEAIGSIEGLVDPTVAAEVTARIVKVHVNPGQIVKKGQLIATLDATDFSLQRSEALAEVARIEVLLENQSKTVARSQALVGKRFISENAVDNELAQQKALQEQLSGAKARVDSINHSRGKTKIYAPTDGVVEKKIIDSGEFVKAGDPIVQIISNHRLRAHIPFPEHLSAKLKSGLKIRLITPTSDEPLETIIHELKPMIIESNRSIDVIADIIGKSGWQAGASVIGTVILGEQPNTIMVPEQSVVLRPAGEVVYLVKGNKAQQVIVKTGLRQRGFVEIIHGLSVNDTIVMDGAGFLTDQAPVEIATKTSI